MKVKQTLLALITLIMATAFFSCSMDMPGAAELKVTEESSTESRYVSTRAFVRGYVLDGDGWGDIKSTPAENGNYPRGTMITVEATPYEGNDSYFAGWYDKKEGGKLVSRDKKLTFALYSHTYLFARFDKEIVKIADPALENLIRSKLNKPQGNFTRSELSQIRELNIYDKGLSYVKDIYEIKYLSNLKKLSINCYDLKDFTSLSKMTGLIHLSIRNGEGIEKNNILSNLKNLRQLELTYSRITDISALSNLTNLTYLDLSGNKITDIAPLKDLTKIIKLDLTGNGLTNLVQFNNKSVMTHLYLDNNNVVDITGLKGLRQLKYLHMMSNNVEDISPLENLSQMRVLNFCYNRITDISPLKNLASLETLSLTSNKVTDISALSKLVNFTELYLGENEIVDITALEQMTKLKILKLDYNRISNIAALTNLTKLQKLKLTTNEIVDITPLKNLTELSEVNIGCNRIADITALLENPGIGAGDEIYIYREHSIPEEQLKALRARVRYVQ